MANHSYMKDRLGFDPDELLNEVDDLFHNNLDDDDFISPSHKKFKASKPSPSSSTSSVLNYENALKDVKGTLMISTHINSTNLHKQHSYLKYNKIPSFQMNAMRYKRKHLQNG